MLILSVLIMKQKNILTQPKVFQGGGGVGSTNFRMYLRFPRYSIDDMSYNPSKLTWHYMMLIKADLPLNFSPPVNSRVMSHAQCQSHSLEL